MSSPLQLTLFGSPEVRLYGQPVTGFRTSKAQALLYYLAVTGRPYTRATLAGLLWGDQPEDAARASLSKCLSNLRDLLGDAMLIERQTIAFNRDHPYDLDTERFATAVGQPLTAVTSQALQAALMLYRGDVLEGFYVREAPDFEQWLLVQRAHYREAVINGLLAVAGFHEQQGDLPSAISHTRRLLTLEPWREEAHRQLMTLLARSGQRATALAQFETCRRVLEEELAVEPDAETTQLYANIRHHRIPPPDRQETVSIQTTVAVPLLTTAQAELVHPQPLAAPEYPLVGRQSACQRLLEMWPKAMETGVQLVCISGEAGIGKTRLAEELLMAVQRQGHATVRTRAYALEGRLAYAPLADWLRSPPLQGNLAKLNPLWLSEVARLLPELLIQEPTLPVPQPLTERWQQKQFFEALRHAFTVDPHPLLLLLDDLQWCDPETLAWLQYLFDTAPQAPFLVVGTVRSDELDEEHSLHKLRRLLLRADKVTTIELTPLSAAETATLAAQVTTHTLDSGAASSLYQTTAGNPLFVIESVRAALSESVGVWGSQDERAVTHSPPHTPTPLPPKVYAVIEARLAQLSPDAHTLAQVAATIGCAFTVPLLVAASHQDEEQVVQGLDELWQRRLVREQNGARYDFSHDRIRDVAYAQSSPVKRSRFHQRVAQSLEQVYSTDLDAISGQIAVHYELAGLPDNAVLFYQRAATVAQQVYAHAQATHQLTKGLALLQQLPVTQEHLRQELRLQFALGISSSVLSGTSASEMREVYLRAQHLAAQVGDDQDRLVAAAGLHISELLCGHLQAAYELAVQCLTLAERIGDPSGRVEAHGRMGTILWWRGQWRASRSHFEQALAQPEYRWDSASVSLWPHHQGVTVQRLLALVLWHLGYPDQALAQMSQALAVAQEITHPITLGKALVWTARLSFYRREPLLALAQAEKTIAFAEQQGLLDWRGEGLVFKGWALVQQGQVETGIAHIHEALATDPQSTTYLSILAEIYGQAGQPAQGLPLLDQVFTHIAMTGECFLEAEMYRLKGELLSMQGADEQEVAAQLLQALAVARQQEAKSLELRAAMSLSRLWQRQGKDSEAHQLLSAIYDWFTEGFDTGDLKEAKALLDTLSAEVL